MFILKLKDSTRRTLALCGMSSLALGLASFNYLPNTYLLNTLKEVVQMYREGTSVPVPENFRKQFEIVMDDMKLNSEEKDAIKPFTVYGFDVFHAGSTFTKNGAIIGIPSNFYYSTLQDVETQNITVLNRTVDWESETGMSFKESFMLSEAAQKYLMASHISIVRSPYVFLKSAYPFFVTTFVYCMARFLNRKLMLLDRPLMFRAVMYTIIGLFGLGTWSFLQDSTTLKCEFKADEEACSLGEEYIKGGVEVYSKLLRRNVALREFMGSKGPRAYTPIGNDVYYVRQKHLPISYRKKYVESCLKNSDKVTATEPTLKEQNA